MGEWGRMLCQETAIEKGVKDETLQTGCAGKTETIGKRYPKREIWVRRCDAGIDLDRRYRWGAGDEGEM